MVRAAVSKRAPRVYPPVGLCIYCGERETPLTREHIVPMGLGGGFVLPKSSCERCRRETHAFETKCLREMFLNYRVRTGLVRHQGDIPAHVPLAVDFEPYKDPRRLPIDDHPPAFAIPQIHSLPGILRDGVPNERITLSYKIFGEQDELRRLKEQNPGFLIGVRLRFDDNAFFRMLAKIAHSFVAGEFGIDSFDPELPNFILGQNPGLVSYLIGEAGHEAPVSSPNITHQLDCVVATSRGRTFVLARIRLFSAIAETPAYDVVAGQIIPTMATLRKIERAR